MTAPQPLASPEPALDKARRKGLVKLLGALLFLALFVNLGWLRGGVCVVWILGNITLYWVLAVWGLMNLRAVFSAFGYAAMWSAGLALLLAAGGLSYAETWAGEFFGFKLPAGLLFFGTAASFAVLFPGFLLGGFAGACAGGWLGPAAEPTRRTRTGVGTWYLVSLALMLGAALCSEIPGWGLVSWALVFGAPVVTALSVRWMTHSGTDPARMSAWVLGLLSNRLILKYERNGLRRRLDLRGAALGLVAGIVALVVGASGVLMPLQSVALVSLVRARNEPLVAGMNLQQFSDHAGRQARRRIVLLTLDPAARREAMTTSSEIAVQIDIIHRLQKWGVNTIVLPAPILGEQQIDPDPLGPPQAQTSDVDRNRKDVPKLEALLRDSRNVVLGLPETRTTFVRRTFAGLAAGSGGRSAELQQVVRAARRPGLARLAFLGAARLPAIPTEWQGEPPLPVVVASSIKRADPAFTPGHGGGTVSFLGNEISEIAPQRLLVDFLSANPAAEFTTLSYSSIRRAEPIADTSDFPHVKWVEPQDYLAGKTVFLDSLTQPMQDTPIGLMPAQELMASATATLLSSSGVHSVSGIGAWLWTLFLAWWTGVLCGRRNPMAAGWRVAGLAVLIFAATSWAFLVLDRWFDPVVPTLAVLGSFILATQLTFEVERAERERQRSLFNRFAGPQLVEQFLDDPDFNGALGGTRQEVCVVFADVRNFTGFAENSTPEEVIEVTNRYLGAMTEAVLHNDGILDKYTGDGLMAFFQNSPSVERAARYGGQPLTVRAVNAAIEMQRGVSRVSRELQAEGREPLRIGVGLHYGEAVVGLVGHADRYDYTAIGHTVVVSQRLQSIASGGEVIISESVYQTVLGMFAVEPGEPVQVKGLSEPVRPYRVSALPLEALPQTPPASA